MSALDYAPSAVASSGRDLLSGRLVPSNGKALVDRVLHFAEIVLIVAMALVLLFGIVCYALVALQCVRHGYNNVAWSGPNGWKFWQFKIVCSR